jgi:hypothetical protein
LRGLHNFAVMTPDIVYGLTFLPLQICRSSSHPIHRSIFSNDNSYSKQPFDKITWFHVSCLCTKAWSRTTCARNKRGMFCPRADMGNAGSTTRPVNATFRPFVSSCTKIRQISCTSTYADGEGCLS